MRHFILGLVLLALVGCGGSTEPSKGKPVDMSSLRMVYAADIPHNGTVADTVFGVIATVQDAEGDTLKHSYVFLNLNGNLNHIIGATTLNGFDIVQSDANGLIAFGVILDSVAGPNTINAVSIRLNLADTSISLIPSTFTITGNATVAQFVSCDTTGLAASGLGNPCSMYGQRTYAVGDTIRTTDFISNGHFGIRDSLGQFKALNAFDRYHNPTTVLRPIYILPCTRTGSVGIFNLTCPWADTVSTRVAAVNDFGFVVTYIIIGGVGSWYYLITAESHEQTNNWVMLPFTDPNVGEVGSGASEWIVQ